MSATTWFSCCKSWNLQKVFSEQLFLYNESFNNIINLYEVQNVLPSDFGIIISKTSGTQ